MWHIYDMWKTERGLFWLNTLYATLIAAFVIWIGLYG